MRTGQAVLLTTVLFGHVLLPSCSRSSRTEPQFADSLGSPDHLATRLMGRRVENQDGQRLGQLKDLAIDARSGRVLYAIVASGGFAGIGPKLSAVPAGAISSATAKAGVAVVEVSRKRWNRIPPLSGRKLANALSEEGFARETHRVFAGSLREPKGLADSQTPVLTSAVPTQADRPQSSPAHSVRLAHDLIGKALRNNQNEVIGRIVDLLVDLSGSVTCYAVVTADEESGGRAFFALPLRLLYSAHGSLRSDGIPEAFHLAHVFDEPAWIHNRLNAHELYRIDGTGAEDVVGR